MHADIRHGAIDPGLARNRALGGFAHMPVQESEGRTLARASGLVDYNRELLKVGEHLVDVEPVGAGRQDGRLDHGMLGTVEPEKLALASLGDRLDNDRCPLVTVIELDHAKLVVPAGIGKDLASDNVGARASRAWAMVPLRWRSVPRAARRR